MVRTQIYLTQEECSYLRSVTRRTGRTRSEVIRDAIDAYVEPKDGKNRLETLRHGRGIWKSRNDLPDFKMLRKGMERFLRKDS